ncbi:MAG: hypothetical protein ACI83W_000225 [Marinoscillum sp.]|jgi:hypothetical protein
MLAYKRGYVDRFLPLTLDYLAKVKGKSHHFYMRHVLSCLVFIITVLATHGQANIVYPQNGRTNSDSLQQKLKSLWTRGYIFSSFDSTATSDSEFYLGKKYKGQLRALRIIDEKNDTSMAASINPRKAIPTEINKQIDVFANNGYPFAAVRWDSIVLFEKSYDGYLTLATGPKVSYDSLEFISETKLSNRFISQVLNVELGTPFSERSFRDIPGVFAGLSFVRLKQVPEVTFDQGKANIYLDLEEVKSNLFEGIVGIFPPQNDQSKLIVTGYLNLRLNNLFNSGKGFGITWNKFDATSQQLALTYSQPYIFGSRLFMGFDFNLLKQDSTFINQEWDVIAGTPLGRKLKLYFGFNRSNGSLISPDNEQISLGYSDYKSSEYLVGIKNDQYGTPIPWRNDVRIASQMSLGEKKINRNSAISDDVYDSMKLITTSLQARAAVEQQVTFGKNYAFYQSLSGRLFYNDQLLQNELIRLGGIKSIRGFNENTFYARHYVLNRLEIRQYFERSSYVHLFADHLLMESLNTTRFASGYGGGLSLNTNNGFLTFAVATGITRDISFNPSNVKIHIGYTSVF